MNGSSANGLLRSLVWREKWLFALFFTLSSAVIFWLPWQYAPGVPVKGESYALGFNNRLATYGLIACVVVHGLSLLWRMPKEGSGCLSLSWLSAAENALPVRRVFGPNLVLLGLITTCQLLFLFWWNGILATPYWSESAYFLSRIDLIALGFNAYKDFQFAYGPLMLFGPLLVDWVSGGSLGIETAYTAFIGACYVLGNICLYAFLRGLNLKSGTFTFALIGGLLLFAPVTMGLNYVPLRFTLVPCLLVLFHTIERKIDRSAWRCLALFGLSSCFCVCGLLVSPEMGIAMFAGLAGYSVMLFFGGSHRDAASTFIGALVALTCVFGLFSPSYLAALLAFKGGSNNLPIFPNLHNLTFLLAVNCVLPLLGVCAIKKPRDQRAPLAIALCLAAGVLISPALGRCDPGHVFFNGLIPLLIMFAACSSLSPVLVRAWSVLFGLCVAVGLISYVNHYAHLFTGSLAERKAIDERPGLYSNWSMRWERLRVASQGGQRLNWSKAVPVSDDAVQLAGSGDLALFGAFDAGLDRLAKLMDGYRPHYHPMPTPEILTMGDVDRAAADFLQHDGILVPSQLVESIDARIDNEAYAKGISSFLSGLMVFPVEAQVRNTPLLPERVILKQLIEKSEVVPSPIEGMTLLRPKPQFQGK